MASKNEKKLSKNIVTEIIKQDSGQDLSVLSPESFDKRENNIFIGTLNIISQPFKDRHEKHYKNSNFHLIVDLILAGIIFILISVIIFMLLWNPKPELILNSYSENLQIISGQREAFILDYEHKSEGLLQNVNISVKFPQNFKFLEAVPNNNFNSNSNIFSLGDLPSGSNGKIKIVGIVYGNVGEQQKISYNFTYIKKGKTFNNFNSMAYNIEGTVLDFSFDAPAYVYEGININKKIYLKNKSDFTIDLAEISLADSDWKILEVQSNLDYKLEANSVIIKSISPGKEGFLDLTMLAEGEGGNSQIKIEAYLYAGGSRLLQKKIERTIAVKQPALRLDLNSDISSVKFEEPINFKIDYENISDHKLENAYLKLSPGNSDLIIKEIKLNNNQSCYLKDNNIYFNPILQKQSGSLNLEVLFAETNRKTNQQVFFSYELGYDIDGQKINYQSASPKIKILSGLTVKSGAYYYSEEGDQLGIGPLPPKLGIPTKYWVKWELDNYGNDLSDIVISAQLDQGISWTENKSVLSGRLIHGEISNLVVWEVDTIEKENDNKHSWYEISYLPVKNDLGKEKILLSNIKFSAFDEFCQKKIEGELENISTDLKYDLLAQGKGEVQE